MRFIVSSFLGILLVIQMGRAKNFYTDVPSGQLNSAFYAQNTSRAPGPKKPKKKVKILWDKKTWIMGCQSPSKSQKQTLKILANKVRGKYSRKGCRSLYKKLRTIPSLNLSRRKVQDLTPLQGMTQLLGLSLSATPVKNITPLSRLTNLQSLYLDRTQVKNLSSLKGLEKLIVLYLDHSKVQNLEPLQEMTQIVALTLHQTNVSDLKPLADLIQIKDLTIWNTQVSDLSPLRRMRKLDSLNLWGVRLKPCSPQNLRELKRGKVCL